MVYKKTRNFIVNSEFNFLETILGYNVDDIIQFKSGFFGNKNCCVYLKYIGEELSKIGEHYYLTKNKIRSKTFSFSFSKIENNFNNNHCTLFFDDVDLIGNTKLEDYQYVFYLYKSKKRLRKYSNSICELSVVNDELDSENVDMQLIKDILEKGNERMIVIDEEIKRKKLFIKNILKIQNNNKNLDLLISNNINSFTEIPKSGYQFRYDVFCLYKLKTSIKSNNKRFILNIKGDRKLDSVITDIVFGHNYSYVLNSFYFDPSVVFNSGSSSNGSPYLLGSFP